MSSSKVLVTIEGSVTPSVVLGRGVRRTVVLTDKIQRLIDRGFVVEVDRQAIKPARKPAVRVTPKVDPVPVARPATEFVSLTDDGD